MKANQTWRLSTPQLKRKTSSKFQAIFKLIFKQQTVDPLQLKALFTTRAIELFRPRIFRIIWALGLRPLAQKFRKSLCPKKLNYALVVKRGIITPRTITCRIYKDFDFIAISAMMGVFTELATVVKSLFKTVAFQQNIKVIVHEAW